MYKKFLSMTLLVSMAHAVSANDLEVAAVDSIENSEASVSTNLEVKEQESEVIAEVVQVQEEVAEVVAEVVEMTENNTEVVEVITAQEQEIEEVPLVTAEPADNEISYGFAVAPKAAELLTGLSVEAQADFNNFSVELGKELLELPEVQAFIAKHETIYSEYKAFKGECPKISVDFFILGEEEIDAINSKLDENNAKFRETLSEENKIKFDEAKQDLSNVLRTALGFTLAKISICKFPAELKNLDTNQELMVNVRAD